MPDPTITPPGAGDATQTLHPDGRAGEETPLSPDAIAAWLTGQYDQTEADATAWRLADVAIKRQIVELHTGSHECSTFEDNCTWIDGDGQACSTLLLLASEFADRPGYDDEWKP